MTPSRSPQSSPGVLRAVVTSVLFWTSLFAAAGLYALVVLSPRLAEHYRLLDEYRGHQVRLVGDEQRLFRLRGIRDAIENDAQFAAELARINLKAKSADEEVLPVDEPLSHHLALEATAADTPAPVFQDAWYRPAIEFFAGNADARGVLLLGAVVLVLFAFVFLQDSVADPEHATDIPYPPWRWWTRMLSRYREPRSPVRHAALLDPHDDPFDGPLRDTDPRPHDVRATEDRPRRRRK